MADWLLEQAGERVEEYTGLIADHLALAGRTQEAVDYLVQAGDRARGLYAHQEAIHAYERALVLLKEQGNDEQAARTLMKLGLAYHNAFQFQQSRQAHDEGFALWQQAVETAPDIPSSPASDALRMAWYRGHGLDPAMEATIAGGWIHEQLFSGLLTENPNLDIAPDVAQSWEVSDGGRRYLFHLRDDVYWSDGVPVTARDFEYAWKRVLDPATGSPNAELLYDVWGARTFHQGKVIPTGSVGCPRPERPHPGGGARRTNRPFPPVACHCTATFPAPRHAIEAHGESWTEVGKFVSNGPFRLEAHPSAELMVLVRNPAYHGRSTGNLQRVELSLLLSRESSPALLEAYEAGDLDVYHPWELPTSDMDRTRQRHPEEFVSEPWLHTHYLSFNTSRPPFDDVRVRRAFVLAMDRETLSGVALGGTVFPATGGFVPPNMAGHSPGIALPYDPDEARKLLAEAGYPGGRGFPPVVCLTLLATVQKEPSEYLRLGLAAGTGRRGQGGGG